MVSGKVKRYVQAIGVTHQKLSKLFNTNVLQLIVRQPSPVSRYLLNLQNFYQGHKIKFIYMYNSDKTNNQDRDKKHVQSKFHINSYTF